MSAAVSNVREQRLMQVLLAPVISEKSTQIAETRNQVTFKVIQDATKPEVKAAVEMLFKVEVKSVQILNRVGKEKRFSQRLGRRQGERRAFVSLKEGQEINFGAEA